MAVRKYLGKKTGGNLFWAGWGMVSEILVHDQLAPFPRACLGAGHHGSLCGGTKSLNSQTANKWEREEPETNCSSRDRLLPLRLHHPPTDQLRALVD